MAATPVPDDQLAKTYDLWIRNEKNYTSVAKLLGLTASSVKNRIRQYKPPPDGAPDLDFPVFPADNVPIERVIDQLAERATIRRKSYEAHTWFPVTVKDKKPIGINWFGDPHVDDNGCDWSLLKRHIDICQRPGIYAANIGDTTNNWAGRLISKYANQDTSVSTARRLASWFLLDCGLKWLVFLLGNHDQWGDGAAILSEMAKRHGTQKIVLHDWEARFSLNFPNGFVFKIWAAHDFPGDSMWNPLHGPVKSARFGPDVDLLVCGHKHNWGVSQWELADKGTTPVMIRTRGYKFNDDYARRIGKTDQSEGSSVFTIINPNGASAAARCMAFADVESGADYLEWLRAKA